MNTNLFYTIKSLEPTNDFPSSYYSKMESMFVQRMVELLGEIPENDDTLVLVEEMLDRADPAIVTRHLSTALKGLPLRAVVLAEDFNGEEGNSTKHIILATEKHSIIRAFDWDECIRRTKQDFERTYSLTSIEPAAE